MGAALAVLFTAKAAPTIIPYVLVIELSLLNLMPVRVRMIFVGRLHVMLTGKRYKADAKNLLHFDFAICFFFYNHQLLITIWQTDRNDQASACL